MAPPPRLHDRPRMRPRFEIGCALLAVALTHAAGAGEGSAAADRRQINPLCALETERQRVELVREGRCCPNQMELLVEDKRTGGLHSIVIESRLRKSATMRLAAGTTLLVAGQLEHAATGVLVIDLDAGVLRDEIRASDYRLSPSKRRLVYASYTSSRDPGIRRSEVLVYDLTPPATADRRVSDSPPGVAVFADDSTPRRLHSPFLWSEDGNRIVLVADFEGQLWLVSVDLAGGLESPAVARQRLAIEGRPDQRPLFSLRWQDHDTVLLGWLGEEEAVAMEVP